MRVKYYLRIRMEDIDNGDNGSVEDDGEYPTNYNLEQLDIVKTVGTGENESVIEEITVLSFFYCRHICPSVPVSAQTFLKTFCPENFILP